MFGYVFTAFIIFLFAVIFGLLRLTPLKLLFTSAPFGCVLADFGYFVILDTLFVSWADLLHYP
jgi:hypothetical protein